MFLYRTSQLLKWHKSLWILKKKKVPFQNKTVYGEKCNTVENDIWQLLWCMFKMYAYGSKMYNFDPLVLLEVYAWNLVKRVKHCRKFQNLLPYCSTVQASTDKERRENCNRKFRNTIGELTKLCHQLSSRCWKIAIYYTRCFWVVVILSPVIRWQYVNRLWLLRIHCPPKRSWFPKGRG